MGRKRAGLAVAATCCLLAAGGGGCGSAHVAELTPTAAAPAPPASNEALDRATQGDAELHDAFTRSAFAEHPLGFVSRGWTKALHGDVGAVSVLAPKTSDAVFNVSLGQLQRWNVGLSLAGVASRAGERANGRITYRDAQPDADLVALETDTRFELALVVRGPAAPRRTEWPIALAKGLHADVVRSAAGRIQSIELEDTTGATRLRIPEPYAVDANGKRIALAVEWQGDRLALTLPAGDLAYPVIVDPALAQAVWVKLATTGDPGPNTYHGMVYDTTRNVVVMFGGVTSSGDVNDVWELSGSTWTKRTWTGTAPSARAQPCFMYDGKRSVLYGGAVNVGLVGGTFFTDAWAWDGTSWTQPFTNVPTQSHFGTGYVDCAWDAGQNVGVMLGNLQINGTDATLSTTVELTGNAWGTPVQASFDTTFAYWLTYDPREQFVMAWGLENASGSGGSPSGWTGSAWNATRFGAPFGVRAWFWDPRRSAMVGIGTDFATNSALTYENTTDPNAVSPSTTPGVGVSERVIFDTLGNRAVMYNGATWIYNHLGGSCAKGGDCDTGYCVDGVCCEQSSCTGTCMSCAFSDPASGASPGICSVVRGDQDPDTCTGMLACDKNGACRAANGHTCASGSDCESGFCVQNVCTGAACASDAACASGHCVDGVCCNTACNVTCQACKASLIENGTGVDGVCGNAKKDLPDPRSSCGTADTTTCGNNGACDGEGSCEKYPTTQSCGGLTCVAAGVAPQSCNGLGACMPGTATPCTPYACEIGATTSIGACATSCTVAGDCDSAVGACVGGQCVTRKADGDTCATNDDCAHGYCTDGHCCNRACSGQCEACDVPASEGTCVPVVGQPHGARTACDAAAANNPCTARLCDGATPTSCEGYAAADIECSAATCANGVASLASHCDGKGTCPSPATKPCAPFACGATACVSACATNADCVGGSTCDPATKTCDTAATCKDDHTVANPNGTDVDCTPYHCANGACLTSCKSVDDCTAPALCDPSLHCVAASSEAASDDSGSCALSARARPSPFPLALLGLVLVAARRRRR